MQVNHSYFRFRLLPAALAALALTASAGAAPNTQQRAGALQSSAATQNVQTLGPRLSGHVPLLAVRHAHLVGRVAASQITPLALTLPLRNPAQLSDFLVRLYTPGDPLAGRFLTSDEFTARFGPTASDYQSVIAAAKSAGFQVTGTHPNRLILDVAAPASVVEAAFSLRLLYYRAQDGHLFQAPDAGPHLPLGLAGCISQVIGLDTVTHLRPHLRPLAEQSLLTGRAGSGVKGGLTPSDIKKAYTLNAVSANGAGQTIALFELDGYTPSDIAAYEASFGLPAVPLQNILVAGATGSAGSNADEVSLDIELAQALAPNLSKILVYEAPNLGSGGAQGFLDCYNRIATDNLARQISTSWGEPESTAKAEQGGTSGTAFTTAENQIFQQMAAQGQSIFSASGDLGAYDDAATLSVDDPGSQPFVTGAGGTTLTTNGTGGTYAGESAWNALPSPADLALPSYSTFGSGGGGGFSMIWPAPSYQANLLPAPAMRSVPDIALNSDPQTGYSIYYAGDWHVYGGTSTAAPLWASFTALVNQQRAAAGKGSIGFLNPSLYQIGASAAYGTDFHDIVSGSNLYYPAVPGYDNATGWGSFVGDALLNTLVNGLPATQTATLTGTVTTADTNAALPNVTVRVLSLGNAAIGTATTNAAGTYSLSVPAGQSLTVAADAYAATNGAYAGAKAPTPALSAGQSSTVNLSLRPAHTFAPGLQMISSPYDYSQVGDFAAVFGLSNSSARLVAWVPNVNAYVFYPTPPANTLLPGTGYWVNLPTSAYPHFDGAQSLGGPFSLPLSAGWNLIGDPFPAAVPLSSVTANGAALPASAVSPTLYRYDASSGQYVAVSAATGALQPYAGYWIYAAQPVSLSIPAP